LSRFAAPWLLTEASVAIDGSKFKAVNNRDKNFTRAKMDRRMAQIEESVARYLQQLDTADRQEPSEALKTKTSRLKEKIEKLKDEMRRLVGLQAVMLATPDQQISLTDPDARSMATSSRGSGALIRGLMTDDEWTYFESFLIRRAGRPPRNHRRVLDAVFWLMGTGAPWRDLPEELGKWNSIFRQFRRWADSGIWV
jgi:hypothetical protein